MRKPSLAHIGLIAVGSLLLIGGSLTIFPAKTHDLGVFLLGALVFVIMPASFLLQVRKGRPEN